MTFKLKGKLYIHIGDGWCIRQITKNDELFWRIYRGYLQKGALHPQVLTAFHFDNDDTVFVDFDDQESAIEFISRQRY